MPAHGELDAAVQQPNDSFRADGARRAVNAMVSIAWPRLGSSRAELLTDADRCDASGASDAAGS